ncbi:MAG: F0F1 ATP synthase subunit B [bacterium]|nr:F0F1 ATP synthase subunit B [bacterium]
MPSFLDMSPGLIFWTLVNFCGFALIIAKYGWKPMMNGLKARENSIRENLENAASASAEAVTRLNESKAKIASAQAEMMTIVREGKNQADAMLRKAHDEAEHLKQHKLVEAMSEIEREKIEAIKTLRAEVSSMVIDATEKLLGRTMQGEDQKRLVESYVNELSKN